LGGAKKDDFGANMYAYVPITEMAVYLWASSIRLYKSK
jgi:hypothetical protein